MSKTPFFMHHHLATVVAITIDKCIFRNNIKRETLFIFFNSTKTLNSLKFFYFVIKIKIRVIGLKPNDAKLTRIHILIDVQITDLGLAKKVGDASFMCSHGGSAGWQAPEAIRGERLISKVDIFNLGCLFYFIALKRYTFEVLIDRLKNVTQYKIETIPR
ncbi:hypothetical protein EIN_447390 [Entamoeba invadens IP1]|uniref:Protein kinase domain-containing protein n=1 Tax=Entamoeba invadens IP1 TaxID=370355 RepID=L7FNV5_ENTIV|nr:hypothetical protein EIN_447390 [Entamoeba invadens IP1]ELP89078.1 hypothetical protein EIN_447390 [Entamoeba invadens IP1]|eukprot:XP_004255849.1 hypothetical protein EIN_447390 [Entamoeba invadens IP1]